MGAIQKLSHWLRVKVRVAAEPVSSLSSALDSGDFHVDLAERRAYVRSTALDLAPDEFDLLVFLLGHRKRIVTPRTYLTTRWDTHGVHQAEFMPLLLRLRKKLEAQAGSGAYIRVEPWVFYRFDPGIGQPARV
jgi:DNA-binding response OmpR family regulator